MTRLWVLLLIAGCVATNINAASPDSLNIIEHTIDPVGPRAPWGKTIGDIDGDGLTDLVVGGHQRSTPGLIDRALIKFGLITPPTTKGQLAWYKNPTWEKTVISDKFAIRTDLEVGDINGDGRNDLVILTDTGMFWLESPHWAPFQISPDRYHDVELVDLDNDQDLDIVTRNQSLFGYQNGDSVTLWVQTTPHQWHTTSIPCPHGEGLKVGDINGDGFGDIVVNGQWLENPGRRWSHSKSWIAHDYGGEWSWLDVYIDIADVNHDGKNDILLSPSEPAGEYYRISWFEQHKTATGDWQEHIIAPHVETVRHFVGAGDMNGDGYLDIVSSEMNQGEDPDEVNVYLNDGTSQNWHKHTLATHGSHGMRIYDFDRDFIDEVFGAPWQIQNYHGEYAVSLWKIADKPSKSNWHRRVIADDSPWRHLFVFSADIDDDGMPDIVTGRHWYRNPGVLSKTWEKHVIGRGANNAVAIRDFDGDGKVDIFASKWEGLTGEASLDLRLWRQLNGGYYPGEAPGNQFVWARNLGNNQFKVFDNIEPAKGDFLQGAAFMPSSQVNGCNDTSLLLLSWHDPAYGLQAYKIPDAPLSENWRWTALTAFSQNEQISAVNFGSGKSAGILTGTAVVDCQDGNRWQPRNIVSPPGIPDRHGVEDVNGDGRLDIVIGYQAVSKIGKLAWYEQPSDNSDLTWREHTIAHIIGPMSLDVTDLDNDGHLDVIAGEHNLLQPKEARLIHFECIDEICNHWRRELIYKGDEHHDGVLAVDLDKDGDKDIVSIGWGHSDIILYENKVDAYQSEN